MSYTSPKFNGEPSVEALANGLATLGRYGDEYMVHATDGETLIPPQIFEANPKLKEDLFVQMRKMGVQDPNRFVVGNSLNSINPITGQPEFFFKKIFKAVKKVFKKALPYIAPIVGNMIAPGIGGIIASALATKLQGGSWGDVAKGAALSYGLGALGQGLTSGKGFMTGLGEGLMAPIHAGSNLFSGGPQNPLAQGIFGTGKALDLGLGFSGGAAPQQKVFGSETLGDIFPSYQTGLGGVQTTHSDLLSGGAGGDTLSGYDEKTRRLFAESGQYDAGQGLDTGEKYSRTLTQGHGPLSDPYATNVNAPSGGQQWQAGDVQTVGETEWVLDPNNKWVKADPKPPRLWSPDFAPGGETAAKMLGEYGVPVALAGLTYFLADDEPELDPEDQKRLSAPQRYAYDKYLARGAKKDAEGQALLLQAGIVPSTDPQTLARATGTSLDEANRYLGSIYGQPTAVAAKGGIMTLQGGGEIMGPGSGTSDSIPARLSDGEFVMTADAVRGAGNGSRDMGAARMYDLMSRFERAA
jgi:hypothetical protein